MSNQIHIGQEIEKKWKESGISKAELGRRTGIVPQQLYVIFKKESIDTEKLTLFSSALNFNFFSLYAQSLMPTSENKEQPANLVICEKCSGRQFKVYITTIVDDARLYCAKCGHLQIGGL